MANKEHVVILKQGAEVWNRWRRETKERPALDRADLRHTNLIDANLSHGNLREVDLRSANLMDANLDGADLDGADASHANLSHANLSYAKLNRAKLADANLSSADLTHADLSYANLSNADLNFANLSLADLHGTDLQNASVGFTTFANSDLSKIKGLDLIRHYGPSTIGIDTIYESGGKIPETFLRGCGVPESFITQIQSLVGAEDGIQFYSCFISYSSKEEEFAKRLHGKMRDAHLRVWFAPEDIQGGKKLHEQIETAIRVYDKLLIVLSESSLQSEWVMTELRKARKAERQTGKRKLFPVRLVEFDTLRDWECFDADSGKDLAVELREYFIPHFSNWKDHDQFEAAFSRLLKDLRAEEGAA